MVTNELAYFTESVNTLIDGKLILVDKHIATLLKCVATSPLLCQCLADTVKTMSYSTEFSRARVSWRNTDGVTISNLKLPADRNKLFAFVVCLLTEIDSGRRNFIDFLREYYNDVDNEQSYAKFVNEVLIPFKRAGENVLRNVDPQSLSNELVEQAENFFKAEKIYIETFFVQQILSTMESIRCTIAEGLTKSQSDEYQMASDYLTNALYLKNPKLIKICWTAYNAVTSKYLLTENLLDNLKVMFGKINM